MRTATEVLRRLDQMEETSFSGSCPTCGQDNDNRRQMARALAVVLLDQRVREWLEANDPQCLAQCERALFNEAD